MSAITTIARAFRGGLNPKPARAYIIPLNIHANDEIVIGDRRSFQYFPASISDSQATNYQTKVIPGLSHPLYQWTSGGARSISFEAIFTRDRTYTKAERLAIKEGVSESSSFTASSSNRASPTTVSYNIGNVTDARNVDVPSAVAWLRSFLLPEYSDDGHGTKSSVPRRPLPPRKMILGLPGVRVNWGVKSLPQHEIFCIMTGCEVTYDAFFNDGSPRMARVALSFAEIIQIGGRILVQDASDKRSMALGGYTTDTTKNLGD